MRSDDEYSSARTRCVVQTYACMCVYVTKQAAFLWLVVTPIPPITMLTCPFPLQSM